MNQIGVEKYGSNSIYNLSIYTNEEEGRELLKSLSFYADDIKIEEKSITLETFGFGGQDESTYSMVKY